MLLKTGRPAKPAAALTEFTSYAGSTATLPHFRCVKTVMSGTTLKNCNQIAATMIGGAGDVVRIQASRGVANTYPDDNGELDVPLARRAVSRDNQRWEDPATGRRWSDTVEARSITRWGGTPRVRRPVSQARAQLAGMPHRASAVLHAADLHLRSFRYRVATSTTRSTSMTRRSPR
ncbi:MAG: hypothetical protein IPG46_16115 [Actinobacteria bacterium]|nr:hypothetical protein [Actinomycetota bacterium]